MKWFRQREHAAWAKGLMFGKTIGTYNERLRVVKLLEGWWADDDADFEETLQQIREGDWEAVGKSE